MVTVFGKWTYARGLISDGSFLFVTVAKNLRPDGTAFPEFVTPDVLVKDDLEFLNRTGHDALDRKSVV